MEGMTGPGFQQDAREASVSCAAIEPAAAAPACDAREVAGVAWRVWNVVQFAFTLAWTAGWITLALLLRPGSGARARLPLLVAPVAFVALVAWVFGRSLKAGRVPLITRIVSGLDGLPPAQLRPDVAAYARSLTGLWTGVLVLLGLANLVLALLAEPGGLLAQAGIDSPYPITHEQWSWFANLLNYGLVGGFFALEFQWRRRRFPDREQGFIGFLRRLGGLGPAFWRDFLR